MAAKRQDEGRRREAERAKAERAKAERAKAERAKAERAKAERGEGPGTWGQAALSAPRTWDDHRPMSRCGPLRGRRDRPGSNVTFR